jgi:hypothetical protein
MHKLSGLILDVADDQRGEILRSVFPTAASMPNFVKSAQYVGESQRSSLPDTMFALVLRDGDVSLRKFACATSGDTALSVEYFMKTAHKLPVEAQKVAARNLCEACSWYDIEPPEGLQKVALGLGTMLSAAFMAPEAVNQAKAIKGNLQIAKQSGGMVNPALAGGAQAAPPQVQ